MRHFSLLLLLQTLFLLPLSQASADEVVLSLSNGKQGVADFRPGSKEKPAVLLLHGFLQTNQFSTIQLMADELATSNYTVLAPTLTLNISQRRNSLGCNAVQNHRADDSRREISDWFAWLKKQGYPRIIAIGHSSGSMRLLHYLSEKPAILPQQFIAVSIGPINSQLDSPKMQQHIRQAKEHISKNDPQIDHYSLGFCRNNYAAPAQAYLSYIAWNEQWVLQRLQNSPVPIHVVLGSADSWVPAGWAATLSSQAIPHTLLDGAGHNFSGTQEFEFQELIVNLVTPVGE